MKDIISISDKAAIQITKIIESSAKKVDAIVISVDKSGCSGYAYKIDYANFNDCKNFELIEAKGVKVFVDPKATMFLIGSEMDYSQDKLASRFVFNNPNEKNSCGCGESFSI